MYSLYCIHVCNYLITFSIGFAKLVSESRTDTQKVPWVLPPTISASQLGSVFKLDWIHRYNDYYMYMYVYMANCY